MQRIVRKGGWNLARAPLAGMILVSGLCSAGRGSAIPVSAKVVDAVTKKGIAGVSVGIYDNNSNWIEMALPGRTMALVRYWPREFRVTLAWSFAIAQTKTRDDGSFSLDAPEPTVYSLVAAGSPEYAVAVQLLAVADMAIPRPDIELKRRAVLHLNPVGPDGRVARGPLAGWYWIATVDHAVLWGRLSAQPTTKGSCSLALPDGLREEDVRRVVVQAGIEGTGCGTLTCMGWPTRTQTLRLRHGGVLSGQVLGTDGKPVSGASVWIAPGSPWGRLSAQEPILRQTGRDGRFRAADLNSGPYAVWTAANEWVGPTAAVAAMLGQGGASVTLHVQQTPLLPALRFSDPQVPYPALVQVADPDVRSRLVPIEGHVVDSAGAGLANLLVFVRPEDDHALMDATLTGADGTFSLRAFPGVHYQLRVVSDDYHNPDLPVLPGPQGATGITCTMAECPPLVVQVVGANDEPVSSDGLLVDAELITDHWGEACDGQVIAGKPGQMEFAAPEPVLEKADYRPVFGQGVPDHDAFPSSAGTMEPMFSGSGPVDDRGPGLYVTARSPAGVASVRLPGWTAGPVTLKLGPMTLKFRPEPPTTGPEGLQIAPSTPKGPPKLVRAGDAPTAPPP